MNKSELIHEMAKDLGSGEAAKRALESMFKQICISLADNQPVALAGFGSFRTSERKARKGRNIHTGEEITIAAGRAVRFVPSKKLKAAIE